MPEKSSTLDERWRALGSPWRPGMLAGEALEAHDAEE